MESQQPDSSLEQASSLPRLETVSQQTSANRSVEGDVQRLADIRASLQDIQRRKSAPLSSPGSAKLTRLRQSSHGNPVSPAQHAAENIYQPLHAASSALFPARQQPFAQRDLNKEVKVQPAAGPTDWLKLPGLCPWRLLYHVYVCAM